MSIPLDISIQNFDSTHVLSMYQSAQERVQEYSRGLDIFSRAGISGKARDELKLAYMDAVQMKNVLHNEIVRRMRLGEDR